MSPAILLVVDDNAIMRRVFARVLRERDGWAVLEACDADEARVVLELMRVDAIVTDLFMPGGGGLEVLEVSRKLDPTRAVVVVTGLAELENLRGFDAVLEKPIDAHALIAILEDMLSRRTPRVG